MYVPDISLLLHLLLDLCENNEMSGIAGVLKKQELLLVYGTMNVNKAAWIVWHRNWHIFDQITCEMSEKAMTRHGSSAE